jgi:YVTN family beta-propeller protein
MKEMEQLENMCAAVPLPDPRRLAPARARLVAGITEGSTAARRGTWLPWHATRARLGRRWLSLATPVAAAVAVAAVIVGTRAVVTAVHGKPAPGSHGPVTGHGAGPSLPHPITAYVTSNGLAEVTPILTGSNKAMPGVAVGGAPGGNSLPAVVFSPDASIAYVLTAPLFAKQGMVTPILTATNKALKPIKVGRYPRYLAITPDGKTIYVSDSGSDTVTPIDTATDEALAPINVGGHPWGIAITPDGRTAYVTTGAGTVTPIRTATGKVLPAIKVGVGPQEIVMTPNGATAYVLDNSGVTPIRTATNTALAPIRVTAFRMGITPDGSTLYALYPGNHGNHEGMVVPIRTATNTVLTPIPVGKAWPDNLAIGFTPDSATAYVVNTKSDIVVPIRTATNTALSPIKVGSTPVAIAITPDGRIAYVADSYPSARFGEVTPIRVSSNTALPPIKVARNPQTIAITPR